MAGREYDIYMKRALGLALKAEGMTSPNPLVGAVVVRSGRVVGEGYHHRAGMPHAEINALRKAGRLARGAVLYVTLEPCDHFGKTPPCTDAIIKSGIRKVVIGMKDPNPINNGSGMRRLSREGIEVVWGVCEGLAKNINKPYIKFVTTGLPFVTLKIAESLDGKIATATGQSKWISNEQSRAYVNILRSGADAVMVGINTVLNDDPMLLPKATFRKERKRVIVDTNLRIPMNSKCVITAKKSPVIVATAKGRISRKRRLLGEKGVELVFLQPKKGKVSLTCLMRELGEMGIVNVLAEGGGRLAGGLFDEGLVDRVVFFVAPMILGGEKAVTAVRGEGVKQIKDAIRAGNIFVKRFGDDVMIQGDIQR
ncbi:MAG: bifunctional diaminohydroxyphosphoribosylaminopyrimidine deaminase/5-amino-6-(5-phosphoribosylamino)uracil reductase RibD [Candidatus Omnitrophota bacterium]